MRNLYALAILLCAACTYAQTVGYWTWIGGTQSTNARSVYGQKGQPSPTVAPGARREPLTWVDNSDNLWLYGGYMSENRLHYHSDMWKYSSGQWAWITGSNCSTCVDQSYPIYGTKGVASPTNRPGARCCSCTWDDAQGNLWMFGGQGVDAAGRLTVLNDLWKFDGQAWTWMGGSSVAGSAGVYGTKGVADPNNMPGARVDGQCWDDADGHFWVYGGQGYAGDRTYGELSDMWKFDHDNWIWMNGSSRITSFISYGQKGSPAPGNTPGSRYDSNGWFDSKGNFWLFGGMHNNDEYNDFWRFDPSGNWAWISGSTTPDVNSTYGTTGFGGPLVTPGSRAVACGHIDARDRLWLFGGTLRDSATWRVLQYNDLWMYDTNTQYWTFVSGAQYPNSNASWGIMGTGSAFSYPSARHSSGIWIDSKNNIYIFGGGIGWSWTQTSYNDFWKFTLGTAPPTTGPVSTTTTTTTGPATSSTTGRPSSTTSSSSSSSSTSGGGNDEGGLKAGVILVGINILLFDIAIVAGVVWFYLKRRAAAGPTYNPVSTFFPGDDGHDDQGV